MYFIDPRGYFGNKKIYGIKEYDYAKLLFGISGYSIFDCKNISKSQLTIDKYNIRIQLPVNHQIYKDYKKLKFNKLSMYLSLAIWLGNSHMFTDRNKQLTSYFTSLFLCEKYLK